MARTWAPGDVAVWMAVFLPLSPVLLLTTWMPHHAAELSPYFLFSVGLILLLAAWIGQSDGWLGLFVGWHGLALLWTQTIAAFETVELLMLAAFGIVVVRQLSEERRRVLASVLVAMGLFQVGYGLIQKIGFDPLWAGLAPIPPMSHVRGTLGNSGLYGAYLAVIGPLAPWWGIPLFFLGALLSKSSLAILALTAGLAWRLRRRPIGLAMIGAGVAVLLAAIVSRGPAWSAGIVERYAIAEYGLTQLSPWQWVNGRGPGAWAGEIPYRQLLAGHNPMALAGSAHNEWVQTLYEVGLLGVGLCAGWLWRWRQSFRGPSGGCLVAALLISIGHFSFRTPNTALAIALVVALATAPVPEPQEVLA